MNSSPPANRPFQQGFSLLELTIVVILVVMLFLVAADRLLPLRGDAEAAQVASVIGGLRSALGLETADRVVVDGLESLAAMEGINPMTLLQDRPANYLGELSGPERREVEKGSWYFDAESRELCYRVRFTQYLEGRPEPPVTLRWRVRIQYDDRDGDGRFGADADRMRGVRLAPVDDHQWPGRPRGR